MHWTDNLRKLGACSDAVEWAKKYPTLEAAWDVCARGDWMLLRAIETAEAYCRGEASLEEVRAASAAASAASFASIAVYAAQCATVRQHYPTPPGEITWAEERKQKP